MHISPILTPDGRPMFSAGGSDAWKNYTYRGWVVSLEWVGDHRRARKCMCIWAATNVLISGEGNGIWCISSRAITEFIGFNADDKCTGGPSVHCLREAHAALPVLGKDANDKEALNSLVDVVVKFAPELVLMPAVPRKVRQQLAGEPWWDVTAMDKNSGRVLHEGTA